MVASDKNKQRGKGAGSPPPHNLPIPPTLLIGRQNELAAATTSFARGVRTHPHGPTRIGKTRLAVEVVTTLLTEFAHGAYFIDLSPVIDANLVLPTIAHTLGLSQATDHPPIEELQDFLANRRVLLVLDNFEQVIQAAPALTDLLQATLHLKILVTSRELLRISGEHNFPVPPLPLPPVLVDQGAPRTLASST
jgi:predicted ATPase